MLVENRLLPFDAIEFSSKWNLHPWELYTLSDQLASSFSRAGILHPPILLAKEGNLFEIVCGFKRLFFAASLQQSPQMNFLILPEDTEPQVVLEIILTDQLSAGSLSLVEKARFLEISSYFLKQGEIINTFFDRLMLDKRPSTFSSLLEVLKQHPLLISETHSGKLQEKIVLELLRLPSAPDRVTMVKLFKRLGMGDGKQRKILPLIRDLASRQHMSIADFLDNSSVRQILNHQDMNNPQKTQHLISFLQQQATPLSINAEIDFTNEVKSLDLPESCTITHSPFFEKDEVSLSIAFKNLSACREWLPKLKQSLS